MSDSYGFNDSLGSIAPERVPEVVNRTRDKTDDLIASAMKFGRIMVQAFAQASTGGKQFDDVLKRLALNLSKLTVQKAFDAFGHDLGKGLPDVLDGRIIKNVTPFAAGGVIGAPGYFPLASGGLGLAGEAGPEAIMPLARGADGRLGIASGGGARAGNITVQISTPDPASFRRSEAYITGQIARAVARGQRSF